MQEMQAANANIATMPPTKRAVIVLDSPKAEQQLRELVALSADIVQVIDKDGREQAHRAGMTLKNARVAIEKIGTGGSMNKPHWVRRDGVWYNTRREEIVIDPMEKVYQFNDMMQAHVEAVDRVGQICLKYVAPAILIALVVSICLVLSMCKEAA